MSRNIAAEVLEGLAGAARLLAPAGRVGRKDYRKPGGRAREGGSIPILAGHKVA